MFCQLRFIKNVFVIRFVNNIDQNQKKGGILKEWLSKTGCHENFKIGDHVIHVSKYSWKNCKKSRQVL